MVDDKWDKLIELVVSILRIYLDLFGPTHLLIYWILHKATACEFDLDKDALQHQFLLPPLLLLSL